MNERYAESIISFPLFQGFTVHGAQRLLDAGEVKEHAPGDLLLVEGDSATFVLLQITGKLEVFVERGGKEVVLTQTSPGAILGELAVLCGIKRSASVRASEESAVLQWSGDAFRSLLLRDPSLSQRIFREALRTLIEKERSLIDALVQTQGAAS
jgi:potassium-dependent mechanosensitive channel